MLTSKNAGNEEVHKELTKYKQALDYIIDKRIHAYFPRHVTSVDYPWV